MSTKRTIGTLTALGGLTAAVALLTGSPAANADELADLRANQQLLEQRVDQLAQVPSPVGGLYGGGPASTAAGAGMVGGSFPRSFLIPGTDTSIRVGGTITFTGMYVIDGGNKNQNNASTSNFGNNGLLNSAPLHVHLASLAASGGLTVTKGGNAARSAGHSLTFFSPQQSKVNFETRTPTAWGEARTFMEFDWANGNQFLTGNNALESTNNLVPRLKFAYASLGGLLAGQANSNFADPDGESENINFGGLTGNSGVTRIPQVRYTVPLAPYGIPGAWSVSAEAPETDGISLGGQLSSDATCAAGVTLTGCFGGVADVDPWKAPAPDLTTAWYIPQPWGHMDFSAVLRPDLEMKDGAFVNRSYMGFGVHFSGDVKPRWFGWDKDYITFQFTWGNGIGRYMAGNSTEFAIVSNYPAAAAPASAAAAANVLARTTVSWGGNTSYQHWWTPTLRSNIGFGILHHDITNVGNQANGYVCQYPLASAAQAAAGVGSALTGSNGCGANKELVATEINLIWNIVPFANVGVEYFWGHRLVLSNLKGDDQGFISRFQMQF